MGSSFTIEDPFQQQKYQGMRTAEKAKLVFKDMGRGMWRQGLGFGKVGALYAGTECVVEGVSISVRHTHTHMHTNFLVKVTYRCVLMTLCAVSSQE